MGSDRVDVLERPAGWQLTTLGKIAEFINGDRGKNYPGPLDRVDSGIPFINTGHIDPNGRLNHERMDYITRERFDKLGGGKVRTGDIVYCLRGSTIGKTARNEYPEGAIASSLTIVRAKPQARQEYLYYFLISPKCQKLAAEHDNGSAQPNLSAKSLSQYPLLLPPLDEQVGIANFLGKLDDKIELNRQMNTTLEAMAQALFKSWFVDFDPVIDNALAAGNPIPDELADRAERRAEAAQQLSPEHPHTLPAAIRQQFPDRFVFTETMGWVPEGWSALTLSSAIHINPKVSLRKGHVAKYVDMKALPTSGYGIDDFVWKPYAGGAKFSNGDVLLARITPCLENGKTGIVDFLEVNEPGFGSTEFIVMRGKGAISPAYVACLARDTNFRLHCVASMVGSSGRQRVQNACFDSYFVCIPEDGEVLKLFNVRCSPFFEKMTALKNDIASLASLRDTLLPKLLSGQLRIPEAEQLVAEVI